MAKITTTVRIPGLELPRQAAPRDASTGPVKDGLEGHLIGQLGLGFVKATAQHSK